VEQRQRRIRSEIAEAERKGDLAGVTALMTERMELDRRLRELDQRMHELVSQGS
jgi:DNA primase